MPIARARLAQLVFGFDALLGILSIGAGALYAAAYARGNPVLTFIALFVPCAALWLAFCHGAYRGLTSERPVHRILFWAFVIVNLVPFPLGTAISGVSLWLRRELRTR